MKVKLEGSAANTGGGSSSSGGDKREAPSTVFEELVQYYESRLGALQRTRDSLEAAKPVLTPPATPPASGDGSQIYQTRCRALLAMELFTELVDDLAMDMVFQAHFEAKQSEAICDMCHTRCQSRYSAARLPQLNGGGCGSSDGAYLHPPGGSGGGVPSGSSSQGAGSSDMFECPSCARSFPAARFASHMDKCMGLSSRRTTTRRSAVNSAASTPNYPLMNYDSSSEQSTDRKRKAAAATAAGTGPAKDGPASGSSASRKKAKRK